MMHPRFLHCRAQRMVQHRRALPLCSNVVVFGPRPAGFMQRRHYLNDPKKWANNTMENVKDYLHRKEILLRGTMIRRRVIKLPFRKNPEIISYSDMCGHGAFVCLAVSYLATDITYLRMSAVSGIVLSIIFQYYREKPLWIPIRWNSFFLLTNVVLLGLLFKEANDADHLPEEQKQLYRQVFKDVGNMKMVDTLHLMLIANRKCYSKGEYIVRKGNKRTQLYLVFKGKCKVINARGEVVGEIGANQFISEQSFITWQNKVAERQQQREKEEAERLKNEGRMMSSVTRWIDDGAKIVGKVGTHIGAKGAGEGASGTNDASNAKGGAGGGSGGGNVGKDGSGSKQKDGGSGPGGGWWHLGSLASWMFLSPDGSGRRGAGDEAEEEAAPDEDGYKSFEDGDWGLIGKADVVVDEDVVLYKWRFDILHEMILRRPSIGIVFERLLSKDLNNKMIATASKQAIKSYQQMVSGAVMGDKVTERKRKHLEKYRSEHNISTEEHNAIIQALGWTVEEFQVGTKGQQSVEIVEYTKLLEGHLGGGQTEISNETKKLLRKFRKQHRIRGEDHEACVSKFNWTVDEYEQGCKDSVLEAVLARGDGSAVTADGTGGGTGGDRNVVESKPARKGRGSAIWAALDGMVGSIAVLPSAVVEMLDNSNGSRGEQGPTGAETHSVVLDMAADSEGQERTKVDMPDALTITPSTGGGMYSSLVQLWGSSSSFWHKRSENSTPQGGETRGSNSLQSNIESDASAAMHPRRMSSGAKLFNRRKMNRSQLRHSSSHTRGGSAEFVSDDYGLPSVEVEDPPPVRTWFEYFWGSSTPAGSDSQQSFDDVFSSSDDDDRSVASPAGPSLAVYPSTISRIKNEGPLSIKTSTPSKNPDETLSPRKQSNRSRIWPSDITNDDGGSGSLPSPRSRGDSFGKSADAALVFDGNDFNVASPAKDSAAVMSKAENEQSESADAIGESNFSPRKERSGSLSDQRMPTSGLEGTESTYEQGKLAVDDATPGDGGIRAPPSSPVPTRRRSRSTAESDSSLLNATPGDATPPNTDYVPADIATAAAAAGRSRASSISADRA